MKNKIAVFVVAAALSAPTGALWASAGEASTPAADGTSASASSQTPAKAHKKHHGHHHKKAQAPAAAGATTVPETK